jgi:nucleoside-diphosphate-sugar epimerase
VERPRIVVTGSSGFVGRQLLDILKDQYKVYGLARRSQAISGAPVHENIRWHQVDIADRVGLERVFREIALDGSADMVIHLAAHYDFTGVEHEEYERTNVRGLRNVLDASRTLDIRHFVFSSSVAACKLPSPGQALDEDSPANGEHIYARTKGIGEAMLGEYAADFHSVIVRFAALFSDFCEYPPLYMFLDTWLSKRWNRRMLGGKGESAIPYLHIKEVPLFMLRLFDKLDTLDQGQVLIASPDEPVSHAELFDIACREYFGRQVRPILMPRALCRPGMQLRDAVGRLTGDRPFEQPWMADYIDTRMTIDAHRTRQMLEWAPRERLEVLERMPFLVSNFKGQPDEWHRANRAAMKNVHMRSFLRLYQLMEHYEQEIAAEYDARLTSEQGKKRFPSYQTMDEEQRLWYTHLILHQLMNAVKTRDRSILTKYCAALAARRYHEGFRSHEVCAAVEMLNAVCFKVLLSDPEGRALKQRMIDHITVSLRAGCDSARDTFETLEAQARARRPEALPDVGRFSGGFGSLVNDRSMREDDGESHRGIAGGGKRDDRR